VPFLIINSWNPPVVKLVGAVPVPPEEFEVQLARVLSVFPDPVLSYQIVGPGIAVAVAVLVHPLASVPVTV
jgi:hypothetical protein